MTDSPRPGAGPVRRARRGLPATRLQAVRAWLQRKMQERFAAFVRRRSDDQLDRTVGSAGGLRMIFKGMERTFRPDRAAGLSADIQYELRAGERTRRWVVRIHDGTIRTGPGRSPSPRLTLRMTVPTFARIMSGEVPPAQAFMEGKIELEGDVELAARMAEIFGQTLPF